MSEQCEFAVLGDGILEYLIAYFLNCAGHKTYLLRTQNIQYQNNIVNLNRQPFHDGSEMIEFVDQKKVLFDYLQKPIHADSLPMKIIQQAHFSDYIDLEKVADSYNLVNNQLVQLPLNKQQLFENEQIEPIIKRRLYKLLTNLNHIVSLHYKQTLSSDLVDQSIISLSKQEQQMYDQKNQFTVKQIITLFKLEQIEAIVCQQFKLNVDDTLEKFIWQYVKYLNSKSKFDDNGEYIICQYSYSDLVQTFERLIFVFGGLIFVEDEIILNFQQKIIKNSQKQQKYSFNIQYEKLLVFDYQVLKNMQSYYKMIIIQNTTLIDQFACKQSKNFVINAEEQMIIVRQGNNKQLAKGYVGIEFFGSEKNITNKYQEQLCNLLNIQQGEIVFEKDYLQKFENCSFFQLFDQQDVIRLTIENKIYTLEQQLTQITKFLHQLNIRQEMVDFESLNNDECISNINQMFPYRKQTNYDMD